MIPVSLLISYHVYMCDFHTGMTWRFHTGMSISYSVYVDYACATRFSLPRDRFIPKRVAVPCLHDNGTSFPSGTKISSRYSNRDELIPV